MKTSLKSEVVLVTGGAVRIGRAIVEDLLREGYRVVVHCRRSVKEARELARRHRGRLAVVQGELGSQADCERIVREARQAFRRLDVLVNSAAVFHKTPLGRISEGDLLGEFWPNLFAPVLLTQAFARQARRGHVINLLDRRVSGHDPGCVPYVLTKKALQTFTESAALALAPRIKVNAVAPGPVLPPPGEGRGYLREHAGRIPLGRPPVPGDVSAAVVALLKSRSTTGQVWFVDGGQHLLGNGV